MTKPPEMRERSVVRTLGHAVGEILLFRIAADVGEGHNDKGKAGRAGPFRRGRRRFRLARRVDFEGIDADRLGDVLQLRRPKIGSLEIEPRLHLAVGILRKADRAGPGDSFQPRGDIDAVAHEVPVALLDHIADVNADAEFNSPLGRHAGVALNEAVLQLDRAAHSIHHTAELDDRAVARALDDAAVMGGDRWIDEIASKSAKARKRSVLVRAGEPAVADDIGDQDRRNFPGLAHGRAPLGAATLAEMPAMVRLF